MEWTNEWIERCALVRRLLDRRLGIPTAHRLLPPLEQLTEAQLNDLALALFDFHSIAEAQAWFSRVTN